LISGAEYFSSSLISKKIKDYYIRNYNFTGFLYGCETGSLILREKLKIRVFDIRVLKRLFGPKWDEVTRGWLRLHNEHLIDLYSLPNNVCVLKSRMRSVGHVASVGFKRGV
jgi:hypothetical protein